jgi:peptidoglycan/LPS O-acetylase OafA/YrhL
LTRTTVVPNVRPDTPATQLTYRKDIDGLRAVSIASVVLFHVLPHLLPGGFVGVDIFFVISGFLISGIIFRSLQNNSFSYLEFYGRRIKRIFPALAIVLLACLLCGWLFLLPYEWRALGRRTFGGAAFASNILSMFEWGYFEVPSTTNPLLHLWSLGIEEQFYLTWPLLLWFAWKRKATMPGLLLAVLGSSLGANLYFISRASTQVFFLPFTRFWELAMGALWAYSSLRSRLQSRRPPKWLSELSAVAGALLLAAALILISERDSYPGALALLPTGAAFLLIAAGPGAWINGTVLSWRPMVYIGKISYPLYLWHWPVLFFWRLLQPDGITIAGRVAVIAAPIALAVATFRFFENPLRHHKSRILVPTALTVAVALPGAVGLLVYSAGVQPRLHGSKVDLLREANLDWVYPFHFNYLKNGEFMAGCVPGTSTQEVLFIGDSHIEQYYPRVRQLSKETYPGFPTSCFVTSSGCPPLRGVSRRGAACTSLLDFALRRARAPTVRTVVFGAFWEHYLGYQKEAELSLLDNDTAGIAASDAALEDFGRTIRSLVRERKKVYVVLSNPIGSEYDPRRMISRLTGIVSAMPVKRDDLIRAVGPAVQKVKAAAIQAGATVIDPMDIMCPSSLCDTTSDAMPINKDADHLRASYAATKTTFIDQIFR